MKIYRVRKKERVDFKRALESWLFTTPLHSIMCMSFFFYSESPWIEEEVFKEEVLSDECKYAHLRICFACSTNNCDFSCVGWISFFKNPKFEYGFTPPQNSLIMSISWQEIYFFNVFYLLQNAHCARRWDAGKLHKPKEVVVVENLLGPQLWQLESNESHKKKVSRQQVRLSRLFETLSDFFKRKKPKPNFVWNYGTFFAIKTL